MRGGGGGGCMGGLAYDRVNARLTLHRDLFARFLVILSLSSSRQRLPRSTNPTFKLQGNKTCLKTETEVKLRISKMKWGDTELEPWVFVYRLAVLSRQPPEPAGREEQLTTLSCGAGLRGVGGARP